MGSERDETYTILVKGKPLASVKADLIHAFLSVSQLQCFSSPKKQTSEAFQYFLVKAVSTTFNLFFFLNNVTTDCRFESQCG